MPTFHPGWPQKVTVVFRKTYQTPPSECIIADAWYKQTFDTQADGSGFPGEKRLITRGSVYYETGKDSPKDPNAIRAYAERLAEEYGRWCSRHRDLKLVGITQWDPEGTTDWIHFEFRKDNTVTRVVSPHASVDPETICGIYGADGCADQELEVYVRGAGRDGNNLVLPWEKWRQIGGAWHKCAAGEDLINICCDPGSSSG